MRKHFSKIVIVIGLILLLVFTVTACNKNRPTPTPTTSPTNQITVLEGVDKLLSAISNTSGIISDTEVMFIDLSGTYTDGITNYDIILKANIDPTGLRADNGKNKIYFEIRANSTVYLGVYYLNEVLYLNLPVNGGLSSEKFYITNLALSDLISFVGFGGGSDLSGNTVLKNMIASFISSATYTEASGVETIVFNLKLAEAAETLFALIETQFEGVNINNLLGMIGFNVDTFLDTLSDYNDANLTIVIDDEYFSRMSYSSGSGTNFNITSFSLSTGANNFTVPINIQQYTEYSPLNFDIQGDLSLKMKAGTYNTPVAGVNVQSNLTAAEFKFNFRIRAKLNLLAPSTNRILVELTMPDSRSVSVYYDGSTNNIYADMTGINAGKLMISGERLAELISSMAGESIESEEETVSTGLSGDLNSVLNIIGIIAPGISLGTDSVEVQFNAARFRSLFEAFGIVLPLDITGCGASVERSGYTVNNVNAWIEAGGVKLELNADTVSVGPVPLIPVPAGLAGYVNAETVEVFSLTLNGTLDMVTGQPDITSFLRGALSNIAGSTISLNPQYPPSGTLINYTAKVGIDAIDGSLYSLQIDLTDTLGRYIVGVSYLTSTEKIYIITQESISGNLVYNAMDYNLSYNVPNFMQLITGQTNPTAPTATESILVTNTLSALTTTFNYTAFYTFMDFLGSTIFDFDNLLTSDYVFNDISFTIGDGFTTRVNFPNNKRLTLTSDQVSISYTPITLTGISEPTTRNVVSVYSNNDMLEVVTLRFSDNSEKKFKVNQWNYNLTGFVPTAGGLVQAHTYILGNRININLNVAASSISSIISNVPIGGFSFDKNNMSIDPKAQIMAYNQVTVRLSSRDIPKALFWDLSALEGINSNGDYYIQGIIYDFFGREKRLPGDDLYYKVTLTGTNITSHTLNTSLQAYGGIDPRLTSSFPQLATLTSEGVLTTNPDAVGSTVYLDWNLTNIINRYNESNFKAHNTGFNLNVTVNVPNNLGTARNVTVNVTMAPAVMTSVDFTGVKLANGSNIDAELSQASNASGISWDNVNKKFVINPLRIRNLTEAVLPATVTMVTGAGSYPFSGLKWEYMPLEITNAGGTYNNILKLTIGDKIGGYQTTFITVQVATININDFEIMNSSEQIIATSNIDSLYKLYAIDNPYNYFMPVKTRVSTSAGDFILPTTWSFPTFNTATLFNGGTYEGTYQAGSQQLKVRMQSLASIALMNGLSFRPEDTDIYFDASKGLVFNPYTSADFTDISIYPTTGLATFSDGIGNTRQLVVPIKWNISAITSLYSGSNPNMYLGKRITVSASTDYSGCGTQTFSVDVYIEEAKIKVSDVVFSIANPTKVLEMNIFGISEGELTFVDPRLTASYPTTIRVSYEGATLPSRILPMNPEDVTVIWNISSVIAAYNQATIISGVSGLYNIIATVGTVRGGFQTVTMQVDITSSELENVVFTNIPLLPNGMPAFDYDNKEGAGYIATFAFDPYLSSIKNSISYPASMSFELEIGGSVYSFTRNIGWNLNSLNSMQPYLGGIFMVEARLPLSSTGFIPIPVRIDVLQKIADTLNGQGLFNIFIDPLDETPFGRRNSISSEVKQTVEVSFVGDSTVMTLTLIYSRQGVKVDFGGGMYLVDAVVGNDFGGYQPIGINGKIQVAIIQREITNIFTDDGELTELYRLEELEVPEGYKIISEINPEILYYESIPERLLFKFTGLSEPMSIPIKTAQSTGLCFEWIEISPTLVEITVYNIIPAFMVNGQDTVFTGNPKVSIDVVELMDVKDILITKGTYGVTYDGTIKDILGELNSYNRIKNVALGIGSEFLVYEYYLNGEIIDSMDIMDSGEYTLRIYVKGHTVYGGYDEVLYTIHKRDHSDRTIIRRGGIQRNTTGQNLTESLQYTGSPITYTAELLGLDFTIDVNYPGGSAPVSVGYYIIQVQVNPQHPNESIENYIYLTITKVQLTESSPSVAITHPESINYGTSDFVITLSAYGSALTGFTHAFYSDSACTVGVSNISTANVGTYYVKIVYIGDNYNINAVKSFTIAPATISNDDIVFTATNMGEGETGPQLELTVFGQGIDISSVVPAYYDNEDCEGDPVNIEEAENGQYWVKIVVEISSNYLPIQPIQTFLKTT